MKTIEEKAKAYDEVLERAKKELNICGSQDCDAARQIFRLFPELAESEDERIMKDIIDFINRVYERQALIITDEERDNWIAWLEKQGERVDNTNKVEPKFKVKYAGSEYNVFETKNIDGVMFYGIEDEPNHIDYVQAENCEIISGYAIKENGSPYPTKPAVFSEQKPTEEVKPKFKVGDWITFYGGKPFKILKVESEQNGILDYLLTRQYGYVSYYNKKYVDENARLWTIEDAKPGDVLVCKGNVKGSNRITYERICLFNNLDSAFFTLTKTSNCVEEYAIDVNIDYPDNTVPATKEQKEILFMTMNEAGYEWDSEKKKLKRQNRKEVRNDKGIVINGNCLYEGDGQLDQDIQKVTNENFFNIIGEDTDDKLISLNKACEYLKNKLPQAMVRSDYYMFNGEFIEDFKKAMK